MTHTPQNNGRWSGLPCDSVWFPDKASVPTSTNDPHRPRTFRALVLGHALRPVTLRGVGAFKRTALKVNLLRLASGSIGVRFRSGEPDFAPFAMATVRVGGYHDERYGSAGTMNAADKASVPHQRERPAPPAHIPGARVGPCAAACYPARRWRLP